MTNEGVNVSLLFGTMSFIVGAFGGLVWIFSAEKGGAGYRADRGTGVMRSRTRRFQSRR